RTERELRGEAFSWKRCMIACQISKSRASQACERSINFTPKELDCAHNARFAERGPSEEQAAPEKDGLGAKRHGLYDVRAAPHPSVEVNFQPLANGVGDSG